MSKPLEGVKVIELATFIAAATAGRFMADLGADVIKIESAKGDPLRYTAPSEGRPLDMYENTTWDLENGNKRCISLNMKTPEGKEAFFKLLDSADVLITNWRVQALQRAGLDYETLKEMCIRDRSRIVQRSWADTVQIKSSYAQTGTWRFTPPTHTARSCAMWLWKRNRKSS